MNADLARALQTPVTSTWVPSRDGFVLSPKVGR